MSHHFDFHTHIILCKTSHPHTGPNRLMTRHVLLIVANHSSYCLVVDGNMVWIDAEHLAPTLATSVFEIMFDICERLINLCIDLLGKLACFTIPATYTYNKSFDTIESNVGLKAYIPCPAHSIRSPTLTAWLYLNFWRFRSPIPL